MDIYVLILYAFLFWDYSTLYFKCKLPAFIFYMQSSLMISHSSWLKHICHITTEATLSPVR